MFLRVCAYVSMCLYVLACVCVRARESVFLYVRICSYVLASMCVRAGGVRGGGGCRVTPGRCGPGAECEAPAPWAFLEPDPPRRRVKAARQWRWATRGAGGGVAGTGIYVRGKADAHRMIIGRGWACLGE